MMTYNEFAGYREQIIRLRQKLAESENLRQGVELGMDCANAEAVRLRQQLAGAQEHINRLRMSLADTEALEVGTCERLAKTRSHLTSSQKREVMLREFVKLLRDYIPSSAVGNMTVQEALAATEPK